MRKLLIYLIPLIYSVADAQVDTIIVYDVRSQEIDIILPPAIDTSVVFDHTEWYTGTAPGFTELLIDVPGDTPPNSGFTDYIPAQNIFDVSDYPIRTAVKLFRFTGDTLRQLCTGTLVSSNLVLTSAHCLFHRFNGGHERIFADSILAGPAFDNGIIHPEFGSSVSTKYYFPKRWYDNIGWHDIGLVKLRDEIGLLAGWIGIAFHEDDAFFQENVFHKLSYPGTVDPFDSTRVFHGDTLYYNYGNLDLITNIYLGYNISGIPGQSGSSLFYTDNHQYYSFGALSWISQSQHYRINRNTFYTLKNIIDKVSTAVEPGPPDIVQEFSLYQNYPNPFNSSTTIKFTVPFQGFVSLEVYDLLGRKAAILMNEEISAGTHSVQWDAAGLASGVYMYRLQSGQFSDTRKLIIIK